MAEGGVDEGERAIRQHAADETGLALDDVAVERLAALESGLVLTPFGQVDGRSRVTQELSARVVARIAAHQYPAVLTIGASRTVLELGGLPRAEVGEKAFVGGLQIVRMNDVAPALPDGFLERHAGEFQPAEIGEFAARGGSAEPHHHRRMICQHSKALLALPQ